LNPVNAGLAPSPDHYLWSSYCDFIGNPAYRDILTDMPVKPSPDVYAAFVSEGNSIFIKDFYGKQHIKGKL
jgi:hypothetical protein